MNTIDTDFLLKVAQTERTGKSGELFQLLDGVFERASVQVPGHPDAVVWGLGNQDPNINPVTHAITDKFSLIATLAAIKTLGVPAYGIPMMAQYRHDTSLAPLDWFGAMPGVSVKWSTAGDFMVDDGQGGTCVVSGQSGNAKLRTAAGVYCNVRTLETGYGTFVSNVRAMPMLPYSQDKGAFKVGDDGMIHTTIHTDGTRLAYACRTFLELVSKGTNSGKKWIGRAAIKPTQAMEDGVMAGILTSLLNQTSMTVRKTYAVDYAESYASEIKRIFGKLPTDFFDGLGDLVGEVYLHIADTNYGLMLEDMIRLKNVVCLSTDLDGDRLTDLMADSPSRLLELVKLTLQQSGSSLDPVELWHQMGYRATMGMDMPSVMYRKKGLPIFEMTLGTADAMLDRLLDGNEFQDASGAKKRPYYPGIHFSLTIDAIKAANPDHEDLHKHLDQQMQAFHRVYSTDREYPSFTEGMSQLAEVIQPWGA